VHDSCISASKSMTRSRRRSKFEHRRDASMTGRGGALCAAGYRMPDVGLWDVSGMSRLHPIATVPRDTV